MSFIQFPTAVVCLTLCLVGAVRADDETQGNSETLPLLSELQEGTALTEDVSAALPSPLVLAEEQSVAQEQLEELAGRHGWKRFSWISVNAPVVIKIQAIEDKNKNSIGHQIYSAFIAYAPVEKLRDEQLMEATFGKVEQEAKKEATTLVKLEAEDLTALSLSPELPKGEGYARIRFPILKKVIVKGIIHMQTKDTGRSVQLAWKLDSGIEQEQATWHAMKPNAVGTLVPTDPENYQGLAGYMSVTQTGLEDNQLLVETHLLIHEPQDWFSGSKLLRSKLSTLMQENARSLRRKLRKL